MVAHKLNLAYQRGHLQSLNLQCKLCKELCNYIDTFSKTDLAMTQKRKCHDENCDLFHAAMRYLTHTIVNVHNNLHVNQIEAV